MQIHDKDFEDYIDLCAENEGQRLVRPSELLEELHTYSRNLREADLSGDLPPWELNSQRFFFRPCELTLWAGINGHGKSMLTGQTMLFLCPRSPVVIASLEMPMHVTVHRMARQAVHCEDMSDAVQAEFLRRLDGNLWVYDNPRRVRWGQIVGLVRYSAQKLQVKHVVIDSLMKCGFAKDDYNGQQEFLDTLVDLAKLHKIHIHLVVHMRKGEREESAPGKFDVRGPGEIVDLCDNLLVVHHNKLKQQMLDRGKEVEPGAPDYTVTVAKQRSGEFQGRVPLYFHKPSLQFLTGPHAKPLEWPRRGEGPLTWGLTAESREPAESHSHSMEFQGYP